MRSKNSPPRSRTALERLAQACRSLAVAKIDAGPQAVALTFRDGTPTTGFEDADDRLSWQGERLILKQPAEHAERRLREANLLLRKLSRRHDKPELRRS